MRHTQLLAPIHSHPSMRTSSILQHCGIQAAAVTVFRSSTVHDKLRALAVHLVAQPHTQRAAATLQPPCMQLYVLSA
jgi:uncharacterized membrane protein